MHPNSSSTFSSEVSVWSGLRIGLVSLGSMLLCLIAIDLAVGFAVGTPYSGKRPRAGQLTWYFDYGRSIEGKVRAMVGAEGTPPPPMVETGWIESPSSQPAQIEEGQDLLIAVYGMSFAAHITKQMQDQDKKIGVRMAGGPGATLSHSYAMYSADRGRHSASVVVLGILASSLPALATISHMTWNFEGPSPHFYPRFAVADGKLSRYTPSISTLAQLQTAARDDSRWEEVISEIATHDAYYDPLVFRSWALDESVLARLSRRAWGQRSKRANIERFHSASGFTNELGLLDVTHEIVNSFVTEVRNDRKLPVILVINDRGYADHLHKALAHFSNEEGALYFSTHELAPATDMGNFVKDGHFTAVKDQLLGRKLLDLLNLRLNRRSSAASVVPP